MRGVDWEEQKLRMSFVVRKVFLINPVVIRRAWICLMSFKVLQ